MAFRSLNFNPRDVFVTARAPGEALEQGIDRLGVGIGAHLHNLKIDREKAKKEADAIKIFRAAKNNDIFSIFDTITDDDNADLAGNLARILMTKNEIDAQAELRRVQADAKKRETDLEDEFYGANGASLLDAIKQHIPLSPEVSVDEMVPVLDANGQPLMEKGQPMFEKRTRVIADAQSETNPLYDVAQKIKAGGKKLSPAIVKQILAENERVTRSAIDRSREMGLQTRAAEQSTRAGQRYVNRSAEEEQKQTNRVELATTNAGIAKELEAIRAMDRTAAINLRADRSMQEVQARIGAAKSEGEADRELKKAIVEQETQLRERLAVAKDQETKERLMASHWLVLERSAQMLMADKNSAMGMIPGLPKEMAWFRVLAAETTDGLEAMIVNRRNAEYAYYTYLIKKLMGGDPTFSEPNRPAPTPEQIAPWIERAKTLGAEVSERGFRKYLDVLNGG